MPAARTAPAGSRAEADARPSTAGRLGVEIRSVNSRFLDLTFKLPEELRQHEAAACANCSRSSLKRGKVEAARPRIESTAPAGVAEPSPRCCSASTACRTASRPGCQAPASSAWPMCCAWRPATAPPAATGARTWPSWPTRVLDDLVAARDREGARLATMLRDRLAQLRKLAEQAAAAGAAAGRAAAHALPGALAGGHGPGGRQRRPKRRRTARLSEATAFAIRIDVAEELTRLASHLDEIERLVKKGGEIGKRLDFLIQELHREANTLGSKSATLELTRIGVDMKVLIEQMREQVQNIE